MRWGSTSTLRPQRSSWSSCGDRLSRFSQPRLSASVISANAMLASRIGTPSSRPSSVASRMSLCPSFKAKLGGPYLFCRNRSWRRSKLRWRRCARLPTGPRLGVPIILLKAKRGGVRPYSESYSDHLVQRARKMAGLPRHVTLAACRHGGMTELADAEITEQGIIALSGHRTPQAARVYVKRTERQRLAASTQRRRFLESERDANDCGNEPAERWEREREQEG